MKIIRSIAGFAWAIASIAIAAILFSSLGLWERKLVVEGGIRISPRFTGGELVRSIDHAGYVTRIHRPVFDGILWDSSRGFVQIDWASSEGELPAQIHEEIDYDLDGKADFALSLDTRKNSASLGPHADEVLAIQDRSSLGELSIKGYPDARFGVFAYPGERTLRVLLRMTGR
jgi:hypothetical protein